MMTDCEAGRVRVGHFNVMPHCVHGVLGRPGGDAALGGLRLHRQRTVVQGGPTALSKFSEFSCEGAP